MVIDVTIEGDRDFR